MESLSKSLGALGEIIIFIILSLTYTSLILLPIILINLLIDKSLISYIFLFVPLIGLLGLAIERAFIGTRNVFVNQKSFYRPYFKELFSTRPIKKYATYCLLLSLYFYSCDSLRILENGSLGLFILRIFLSLAFRNIIFYTILQRAFRKELGFVETIKNSAILTLKYPLYAIIICLVWGLIEELMIKNALWTYVLVIILGFMGNFINQSKVKNL
ncbi:hypothetical protein NH286_08085 [Anaerococcus sp. NML200574]|uniref:hypothetical protein n=1 Tax=Anaerococcus sp. NML200574 TaxID=2954486 RepID=UPI0022385B02|nr:hypothetical protein [Anaerococcus sp. NML200574]MCW6679112.1 hypothetical protein [Anaerococcus sp. NML200574]